MMITTPWMGKRFEPGLVSIIIPTFNRAGMVARALDSALKQSYRPTEIVLVDDGSTDDTAAVVSQWREKGLPEGVSFQFLENEHAGAPAARNAGLAVSTGEFIQFFDSDDVMVSTKLEDQVTALRQTGCDIAWSAIGKSDRVESVLESAHSSQSLYTPCPPDRIPGSLAGSLLRRSLCLKVGPWSLGLRRYQDWEYSVRCTALARNCVSSSDISYWAIQHCETRIANVDNSIERLAELAAAAVTSAESHDVCAKSPKARIRIGQKALDPFMVYLSLGDRYRTQKSMSSVRRNLPWHKTSRLKAEILMLTAQLTGPKITQKLARSVLSRR